MSIHADAALAFARAQGFTLVLTEDRKGIKVAEGKLPAQLKAAVTAEKESVILRLRMDDGMNHLWQMEQAGETETPRYRQFLAAFTHLLAQLDEECPLEVPHAA